MKILIYVGHVGHLTTRGMQSTIREMLPYAKDSTMSSLNESTDLCQKVMSSIIVTALASIADDLISDLQQISKILGMGHIASCPALRESRIIRAPGNIKRLFVTTTNAFISDSIPRKQTLHELIRPPPGNYVVSSLDVSI
jgi:hypothetical protein